MKITEAHLKLANRMYVSWDDCEFGAPSINCKRPYGNSNVIKDMAEILGLPIPDDGEMPETLVDYLIELHKSMEEALQIFLCTGKFETGTYEKKDEYDSRSWQKIT